MDVAAGDTVGEVLDVKLPVAPGVRVRVRESVHVGVRVGTPVSAAVLGTVSDIVGVLDGGVTVEVAVGTSGGGGTTVADLVSVSIGLSVLEDVKDLVSVGTGVIVLLEDGVSVLAGVPVLVKDLVSVLAGVLVPVAVEVGSGVTAGNSQMYLFRESKITSLHCKSGRTIIAFSSAFPPWVGSVDFQLHQPLGVWQVPPLPPTHSCAPETRGGPYSQVHVLVNRRSLPAKYAYPGKEVPCKSASSWLASSIDCTTPK